MTVRILCTGDIHIGRRASRISASHRSADIWMAIVDLAISERVDLVAISGDIVDKESKSYEALGPMQQGLSRLDDAGIDTVAVTGNHDHDVLVRLAGTTGTGRFHLLGVGGTWERWTLTRDGYPCLHVDGWSFPREHVTEPPLQALSMLPAGGVPVLGLLHGEVGVAGSRYAPIDLNALWSHPVDVWLLGHIHAPRQFRSPGRAVAFYPGSPLALDPGEPGTHGPWMVELDANEPPVLRQIPMSPVRYEAVEVDVSGVETEESFQSALNQALLDIGRRAPDGCKVVSARLLFTGRSPAHALLPAWIDRAREAIQHYDVGSRVVDIDRMESDVRPHIDLASLASASDPAGETAKLILALHDPEPEPNYQDLIRTTLDDLRSVYHHATYAPLRTREESPGIDLPKESDARALLADRAWHVLSALIAQKDLS